MQNKDKEKNYNRFFYDIQKRRMLYIPYALLTMQGAIWMIGVVVSYKLGLPSLIGTFYYTALILGLFFMVVYQKYFYETIQDRENLWLFEKIQDYLGIERCKDE